MHGTKYFPFTRTHVGLYIVTEWNQHGVCIEYEGMANDVAQHTACMTDHHASGVSLS
jgi:hypothetical protein